MSFIKRAWVMVAIMFVAAPAFAGTVEDGRIWLNFTAQGDLPVDGLRWYAELQPRWRQEGEQIDSLLVRPAVSYKLSEHSSVWFGYGYVASYPVSGGTVNEDRLWQQYLYTFSPVNSITFSSRTRLEERRLETGNDTGYRIRQMLRASRPFAEQPALGLVVWDELFMNTNTTDWGAHSGFDQNRAFAGLSYAFTSNTKVEAGYLNQYVRAVGNDRMNHVLSSTISINF